jgi:maleylpyruvate isomerase
VSALMGRRRKELERQGVTLRWTATDTGDTWDTGSAKAPEVRGTAADILWWLLGRGDGDRLACSEGQLPSIGRWT